MVARAAASSAGAALRTAGGARKPPAEGAREYTRSLAYMRTGARSQACMLSPTHARARECVRSIVRSHVHQHTCPQKRACTHTHARKHARTHTHTQTHTNTHIPTHTQTHAHARACNRHGTSHRILRSSARWSKTQRARAAISPSRSTPCRRCSPASVRGAAVLFTPLPYSTLVLYARRRRSSASAYVCVLCCTRVVRARLWYLLLVRTDRPTKKLWGFQWLCGCSGSATRCTRT